VKFVNLHHHSTFSHGDGFGTPAQHVARAAELGYSAIALTEHGNVSSHFQLEKAAKKAGIKPIFGVEAYCGEVDPETRQQYKFHLTILAANETGYRNLNRIVTKSYTDFHYHPTVSGSSLAEFSDGLAVLSGCSGSLLACTLLGGKGLPDQDRPNLEGARKVAERFQRVFGDRFFLEIQPFPELERTGAINTSYAWLAAVTGIPLVVTNDVHYTKQDEAEMQAVLHAVHRGKASVDDVMREWNYEVPLTLPESDNDLFYRLRDTGLSRTEAIKAIENSAAIADMLNVTLPKAERLRYPATEEDLVPW
jgi:DNA polymerase-3 subunit alpha